MRYVAILINFLLIGQSACSRVRFHPARSQYGRPVVMYVLLCEHGRGFRAVGQICWMAVEMLAFKNGTWYITLYGTMAIVYAVLKRPAPCIMYRSAWLPIVSYHLDETKTCIFSQCHNFVSTGLIIDGMPASNKKNRMSFWWELSARSFSC
jgi:hypothetical protein